MLYAMRFDSVVDSGTVADSLVTDLQAVVDVQPKASGIMGEGTVKRLDLAGGSEIHVSFFVRLTSNVIATFKSSCESVLVGGTYPGHVLRVNYFRHDCTDDGTPGSCAEVAA